MKPADFYHANRTLCAPQDQPQVQPLRCHWSPEKMTWTSCWTLTWWERLKLVATGRVWLLVNSFAHPPVALTSDAPFVRRNGKDLIELAETATNAARKAAGL